MAKIGRNAPCPCGSGKKYKACCQRQARDRQRQDRLESEAAGKALAWLDEHYGEAMVEAFREDFLGGLDDEALKSLGQLPESLWTALDINGRELVLAEGELELDEGRVPCLGLVFGPGGPLLDAVQREYLEKLGRRPLSLYEVVEVKPGEGFRLRDLVDEEEPVRWIVERAGSQGEGASEGSVFGARLIPGSPWKLSGAIYSFPEPQVLPILEELRFELGGKPNPALDRQVRSTVLVDAWLRILTMPPPTVVDTSTGEALLLVNDYYRVADWDRLEVALAAEPDVEGDRSAGWTRFEEVGDEMRRSRLAINPGEADRIEAFARTLKMADDGKAWLQQVAGDAIEWITREIVDPASAWNRRFDADAKAPAQALDPADLPEGFYQQVYEQQYADWADQRIPALGDRTPRQSLETAKGRRKVVDLLESYERAEKGQARAQGRSEATFDFLWRELGLERT